MFMPRCLRATPSAAGIFEAESFPQVCLLKQAKCAKNLTRKGKRAIVGSLVLFGEMAERLMAPVLKTGDAPKAPGVRIPLSPPFSYLLDMEKYPRGRRGSPAKGVVCDKRSPGSNPGFSAWKNPCTVTGARVFFYPKWFKQTKTPGIPSNCSKCRALFPYASMARCLRWFKSVSKVEKNMLMVAAARPATIRYQVAALRTFRKE